MDLPAAVVLVVPLCLSYNSLSSPFLFLLAENFTDSTGLGNGE